MNPMSLRHFTVAVVLASLAAGPAAFAQPKTAPAAASQPNLPQSWAKDPHMHAFYDATVVAFARGPAQVDFPAYEAKCFAIFRDFGAAHGMDAAKIYEGTKLLPRQVVQIVKEDPSVLESYDNFVAATAGPP
jgi:hypothetical protein